MSKPSQLFATVELLYQTEILNTHILKGSALWDWHTPFSLNILTVTETHSFPNKKQFVCEVQFVISVPQFPRYLKLLKGNGTFATSKSFYRCWRALLHMRKKSCIKPSVAPAMSLESVSVGADDKSENETRLRVCTVDLWCPLLLSAWGWGLKATVATISIAHLNLQPNCWQLSCIMGNVGASFRQGRRMCGIKNYDTSNRLIFFLKTECNAKSVEYS